MVSLPNMLSLACIAAVGGLVTIGHTVLRDRTPDKPVNAFLYGVDESLEMPGSDDPLIRRIKVFGDVDEQAALDYAADRYHEIYAEALDADVPDREATSDGPVTPKENFDRPLRSSDFHHLRAKAAASRNTSNAARSRTVFSRSRRAELLSKLGRAFPRAGTGNYLRTGRDDKPISPTGRQTIFQRSRFYGTQSTSKYSYSGYGRIRRVPRRVRR